jgi:crotonobetainyl-CoA:carnitine CoA-transferase CaiB-like acyl-CoA transferase
MSPYRKLVAVLGDDSLNAYDDPTTLFDKRDEIWEKLAALTRTWTTADLMEAMLAVDIWCGEVKTHLEAAADPQVAHMQAIGAYDHPKAGHVKVVAPAVKMGETPAEIARPAPMIGEHTREVLAEFGFSSEDIRGFLDGGGVAEAAE